MELVDYLKNNTLESLRDDNIKIYKFKNLRLLRYKYDDKITKEHLKYCKGCIYNVDTKELVCVPPKRVNKYNNEEIDDTFEIQGLIDGTMFNVFYTNDEWNISTRSDIGGKNKWGNKSFINLIEDVCSLNSITSVLNKEYSYSFILRHKMNRCVSNVEFNAIVLTDIYDRNNNKYVDNLYTHFNKEIPFYIVNIYNINNLDRFMNQNLDYNWKGIIIKKGNIRYKYINPNYEKAKELSVNTNNTVVKYINCLKNKNIGKYLRLYPESKKEFNKYKDIIEIIVNEIYNNYYKLKIKKEIEFKDIPFHIRPYINEIHEEYIIKNKRIDNRFIKYYLINQPEERIRFIMNNYIV